MSVRRGKSGPLKAWISEFVTKKQNKRKRYSKPAIVLSHKGLTKNGNHIKEISDGCVYIKALFTKSAVSKAEGGKCSTEDWSTGLILLRDVKLELQYDLQAPEFVLVVDNFSIWDYQKGFLPKKRFEWCMNDSIVQEAAVLAAKDKHDMTGSVISEMGDNAESQSISYLLEQMAEASAESDSTTNSVLPSVEASRTEKNWITALRKPLSVPEFLIPTPTETDLNAIKEWDIDYRIPSSSSEKDRHSSSMEEFNIQRVSTLARDDNHLPESELLQGHIQVSQELEASSSQIRQVSSEHAHSQSERSGWQDCLDSVELSDDSLDIGSPEAHSTQKDKETVTHSRPYTTDSVSKGQGGNLSRLTNKTSNDINSAKIVMINIDGDSSLGASCYSRDAEQSSSVTLVEKDNSSPIVISSDSTQSDLLLKAIPVRRSITVCEQDELSRLGVLRTVCKSITGLTSDSEFSQSALYHQSIINGHPTLNKLSGQHTQTPVKVIQKPAKGSEDLFQDSLTPEESSCQPAGKDMSEQAGEETSDIQTNLSKDQSLWESSNNSADLVSPSSCKRIITIPRVPQRASKDGKRQITLKEFLTKAVCGVKKQKLKTGSKHQQTNMLRSSQDSDVSNEKQASLDSERSIMLRYYSPENKSPSKSKVSSDSKKSEENGIENNGEEYSFTDKDIFTKKTPQSDNRMSANKHIEPQSKEVIIDDIVNKQSDSNIELHNKETNDANDSRNIDANNESEMLNKDTNTESLTLHTSFENTSNENCLDCNKDDGNCDKQEFMNSLELSSACLRESNEGSKEQAEMSKDSIVIRGRLKYHLFEKARNDIWYKLKSPKKGERQLSQYVKKMVHCGKRKSIPPKKKSLPIENTSPGSCSVNVMETESVDSILKPCTVDLYKLDESKLRMLSVDNKSATNNSRLPKHQSDSDDKLSNESMTHDAQTIIDAAQPYLVEENVEHGRKVDGNSSESPTLMFNTQPFETFQETQEFEPMMSPETEQTVLNFIIDARNDSFCSGPTDNSDENIDYEKAHFNNRQTYRCNSIQKMKAKFREKAEKMGLQLNALSKADARTEKVADVDKEGNVKTNKSKTAVVDEDKKNSKRNNSINDGEQVIRTLSENIDAVHVGVNNDTYTIEDESCSIDSDKTNKSAEKVNIAGPNVFHSKQMDKTVDHDISEDLSNMQSKKDDQEEELNSETFSNDEHGTLSDGSNEIIFIRSENKSNELPSTNKVIEQTKFKDRGVAGYSHKRKCEAPLKEDLHSKRVRLDTDNKEYNLLASGAEIEYLLNKLPPRESTLEIVNTYTSLRKEESEETVLMSLFPVMKVLHRKYQIKPLSKQHRQKKVDMRDCFNLQLKGFKKKQVAPDTPRSGLKNNKKSTRDVVGGSCVNNKRQTGAAVFNQTNTTLQKKNGTLEKETEIQTNTNMLLVNKELSSHVNETILDKKNETYQNEMDSQTTSNILPVNKESASNLKGAGLNEKMRNLRDRGKLKTRNQLKFVVDESTGARRFYRENHSNSQISETTKTRNIRPQKKSSAEINSNNMKSKSNKGSDSVKGKASRQRDIPSPGKSESTHNIRRSKHTKENVSVDLRSKTSKKRTDRMLDNNVQAPTVHNLKQNRFNEVIDKESFLNDWLSKSNFTPTESQSSDDKT